MTKTGKIALITGVLLLAAGVTVYALRKKKILPPKKKTNIIVGSSEPNTPVGEDLKIGSTDEQHVSQLQNVLNEIHQAVIYINNNCSGIKWPVFKQWSSSPILNDNGKFDTRTAAVCQFYLNRQEVDLAYLTWIRNKLAAYHQGDKCIYPLSINIPFPGTQSVQAVLAQASKTWGSLFN